jgi:hypothetical protein
MLLSSLIKRLKLLFTSQLPWLPATTMLSSDSWQGKTIASDRKSGATF